MGSAIGGIATGYAMTFLLFPHLGITESPDKLRAKITNCANQLGATAVKDAQLPQICERFENYFEKTVRDETTSIGGTVSTYSTATTYNLPSATDFTDNRLQALHESEAGDEKFQTYMPLIIGGFITLAAGTAVWSGGIKSTKDVTDLSTQLELPFRPE